MLQLVPWSLGVAALQARLAPLIWARVSCVDEPPGVTVSLPSRCRVSGELADTVLADGYAWVQQQRMVSVAFGLTCRYLCLFGAV